MQPPGGDPAQPQQMQAAEAEIAVAERRTAFPLQLVPRSAAGHSPTSARGLLRRGQAAGPVFVAAFLLEGAVRDGYLPLRHPVSSLALGSRGWIQAPNFAVTGTLFLAGAAGLSRAVDPATTSRAARALIGAADAGLIGSAVFPTGPVNGYPPGSPDALPGPSHTGTAHNLAAILFFLGLPAAARLQLAVLAVLADRPALVRALQREHRRHHADHHGAGLCGLRSIAPACQSWRTVPARQHHHRLRLAHSPVRTSTSACARHPQRQTTTSLNAGAAFPSPQHARAARRMSASCKLLSSWHKRVTHCLASPAGRRGLLFHGFPKDAMCLPTKSHVSSLGEPISTA